MTTRPAMVPFRTVFAAAAFAVLGACEYSGYGPYGPTGPHNPSCTNVNVLGCTNYGGPTQPTQPPVEVLDSLGIEVGTTLGRALRWAPNASELFVARDGGVDAIDRAGTSRLVAPNMRQVDGIRTSSDGQRVYLLGYDSVLSGAASVYRVADGVTTPMLTTTSYTSGAFEVSPDQRFVTTQSAIYDLVDGTKRTYSLPGSPTSSSESGALVLLRDAAADDFRSAFTRVTTLRVADGFMRLVWQRPLLPIRQTRALATRWRGETIEVLILVDSAGTHTIRVVDTGTGAETVVADSPAAGDRIMGASWSENGLTLALLVSTGASVYNYNAALHALSTDGTYFDYVISGTINAAVSRLTVSPDGTLLAIEYKGKARLKLLR